MAQFQPKITRARFVLGPFTSEQMQAIGQVAADTIKTRILSGKNVEDQAAKPLSMRYKKRADESGRLTYGSDTGYRGLKLKRGLAPIRDWFFRGLTIGSLKVKSANENRVVVGFVNDQADKIAHINNLREKAFGVSPNDRNVINAAVLATLKQFRIIRFKKVA